MALTASLSTSRGRAAIVALALLLASPALGTGLVADDFIHTLMLDEEPGISGMVHRPLDLFAFATGDVTANQQLMDEGVFPWWADAAVVLSFWRPLSCLTHLLDHWLWPQSPLLMHLQSLAWFALVLVGVGCLYRRLLAPPWMAGFALLLFAVDDARAPVVAWIANRNALVAMAFATPALVLHDRWRRDGDKRAGWLGPLMFALGLLASETAFAVAGYLVAYTVCLDRGRLRDRLRSLAPYAALVLGWRLLYVWTGHGVAGSGVYVDLARDPLGFMHAAALRLPVLLSAAFIGPWAELWEALGLWAPGLQAWMLAWSVVVIAIAILVVVPVAKKDPVTRFFAVGCILASVAMCSTFAHDRLLLVPGLGSMAVVARAIAWWAETPRPRRFASTAVVGVLVLVHLVVGPLLFPVRAYAAVGGVSHLLNHAYDSIPSDPTVEQRTVILVNPPFDPFAAYLPLARQVEKRPRPRRLRWLATGATALTIERTDERTLQIEATPGWLTTSSEQMLRNPDTAPAHVGDVVHLSDVSFEVTKVIDGRPEAVRARFSLPLDDRRLQWLAWDRDTRAFVPFALPPIGGSVHIAPVDMWQALCPLPNCRADIPAVAASPKGDVAQP